uniref:Uncharacterized protein n=1 Tax=Romanomermis culicivorax TaxID=13658 RepID=A0A915HW48_ROMCU
MDALKKSESARSATKEFELELTQAFVQSGIPLHKINCTALKAYKNPASTYMTYCWIQLQMLSSASQNNQMPIYYRRTTCILSHFQNLMESFTAKQSSSICQKSRILQRSKLFDMYNMYSRMTVTVPITVNYIIIHFGTNNIVGMDNKYAGIPSDWYIAFGLFNYGIKTPIKGDKELHQIFEVWHYNNVEKYHPTKKPDGSLFTQYINIFMQMKLFGQ